MNRFMTWFRGLSDRTICIICALVAMPLMYFAVKLLFAGLVGLLVLASLVGFGVLAVWCWKDQGHRERVGVPASAIVLMLAVECSSWPITTFWWEWYPFQTVMAGVSFVVLTAFLSVNTTWERNGSRRLLRLVYIGNGIVGMMFMLATVPATSADRVFWEVSQSRVKRELAVLDERVAELGEREENGELSDAEYKELRELREKQHAVFEKYGVAPVSRSLLGSLLDVVDTRPETLIERARKLDVGDTAEAHLVVSPGDERCFSMPAPDARHIFNATAGLDCVSKGDCSVEWRDPVAEPRVQSGRVHRTVCLKVAPGAHGAGRFRVISTRTG